MLQTTSLRISSELSHHLEDLAARRDIPVSALMRDILLEYAGHKRSDFTHISEQLQFTISLVIKTLYLVRFLADGVDKETTEQVLKEAESFILENGLDSSVNNNGANHG